MIYLMRHPKVIKSYQQKCYGKSDIGISREGKAAFMAMLGEIIAINPDVVIHSGLRRTKIPAEIIAKHNNAEIIQDELWQERNFGEWEGKSWNEIYRKTQNQMDGFLTKPDSFAPTGGETTSQLIARSQFALNKLTQFDGKRVLVIAHGGTIAAARMLAGDLPFAQMVGLIPKNLEIVCLIGKL